MLQVVVSLFEKVGQKQGFQLADVEVRQNIGLGNGQYYCPVNQKDPDWM